MQQRLGISRLDFVGRVREDRLEFRQKLTSLRLTWIDRHPDARRPRFLRGQLAGELSRLARVSHQLAQSREQRAGFLGRLDVTREPLQQRKSKFLLENLDTARNRRLGYV